MQNIIYATVTQFCNLTHTVSIGILRGPSLQSREKQLKTSSISMYPVLVLFSFTVFFLCPSVKLILQPKQQRLFKDIYMQASMCVRGKVG